MLSEAEEVPRNPVQAEKQLAGLLLRSLDCVTVSGKTYYVLETPIMVSESKFLKSNPVEDQDWGRVQDTL